MKNLRAIILAAGKGTRMKSTRPKVLHEIFGKPLIDYVCEVVRSVGSLKTHVILGHQFDQVKAHLGNEYACIRQKHLAGTADAVKSAKSHFKSYDGDVLLLCGDTPLLQKDTVKNLIARHRESKADCTVLTAVIENNFGYGRIIRDSDGKISAIREENDANGFEKKITEINVGVYCIKNKLLFRLIGDIKRNPVKGEYYLTDIIQIFFRKNFRVESFEIEDAREGLGVNTRIDLALCGEIIRQRILREHMFNGVTVIDPATIYIGADAKIGVDTVIHPFTVIENDVRIGANCSVGPFAHLRPGTSIADDVTIGNFAEVSRTEIGRGSIAKHFGFLGDARIGSRVNIGAGTVTANYDGKNKNVTKIEDGAFIGSDSILVAPVKIGKKAMTGAGCVVTKGKSVPSGHVIVGVPGRILDRNKKPKISR